MIKSKQQTVDLLLLIFTVIVGILSYILNFGWIRLIFFLPFLGYNAIVLITGVMYVFKQHEKRKIKQRRGFYIGLLTYILFNVFLCDGGDIGPPYCFFGLIKMYGDGSLLSYISTISFVISLICIILNIKVIISKKMN